MPINDDEIVGCLGLLIIKKAAKLSFMYLKDDFRGSSVGLALINFVKDYAKIGSKFYDDLIMMCEL